MDALILHKGHVTHIIDPSSFWMKMGTDADFQEFEDYQNTLNKFYNKTGRSDNVSADTLTQGDCVMVAESSRRQIINDEVNTDFQWNRARVSRMDGDTVDVFYIDLGYTEIVHMSRVKNINRELFDYHPSQVIQLRLAGIRPLARSWTSRAANMFESRVLDQEVVVSLIDYDEVSKYGKVVIYIQCGSSNWRCLTHEMLDEDLGLPVEPMPDEFLSQEVVLTALARGEQDSSLNSCGLDSNRNNNAAGDLNETESRENMSVPDLGQSVPDPDLGQSVSSLNAGQHLTPDRFSTPIPPNQSSASCRNADAWVPAFDLSALGRTRSLSVSKMQEDKVEEQRFLTRARLQQELEDNEEEDDNEQEIDWGKSDLLIGKTGVFSDFDCIRQEIYKHSDHPSHGDVGDFFYSVTGIHKATSIAKTSAVEEKKVNDNTQRDSSKKDLKPLTEKEDYEIGKKIEEILLGKDSGELNMVCVLINSIIEPDITVPCDRLVAVFTAILETVLCNCNVDPLIAFGALETYLGTSHFEMALESVLKSLRSSFVKLSRNKQSSNCHRAFVDFLVMFFLHAGNWPSCSCLLVHEFVMASLERWVIFNKGRMQSSDSSMGVERIYLECVEVVIDGAGEKLHQQFPDRYCLLLEDIKHKLVHDSTQRIIREQLLNILLKLHTQVSSSTPKTTSERRGVGVQTEASLDHSSEQHNEVSAATHAPVEEDMKTADDMGSYGLMGDVLITSDHSDRSPSSWSDEDCEDGAHSLSSVDTVLAIHSLKRTDSIPDMNSAASVAGCNIADFDSNTSSAPLACGASSDSLLIAGNDTRFPGAVPPHLQENVSQDNNFKDEINAVGRSDELNAVDEEVTFSASQNALEQKGEKQTQLGHSLDTHETQGDKHDQNDSKLLGVNTMKQTKVFKLNISAPEFIPRLSGNAPEFIPRLSGSCLQPDQVKMFKSSSVNVPEYGADTGVISVKPAGGTNSELIQPVRRDMENDNTVANIEEGVLFVDVGNEESMDQQKYFSGNSDKTYTVSQSLSDLEQSSDPGSTPPENAAESFGMNILENKIKYTAQELKALNMSNSPYLIDVDLTRESSLANTGNSPHLIDVDLTRESSLANTGSSPHLLDVDLTRESSLADILVQKAENKSEEQAAELESSPSAIPHLRYTGREGSPLEISVGPKSNSAKWKSLSELLPPSRLKRRPYTVKPSTPPEPAGCDTNNAVLHTSEQADPNSLYSIALSLFPAKDQPVPGTVDILGSEDASSSDNTEHSIVRDLRDVTNDAPQWPETFFRSVRSAKDTTQSRSVDVPLSSNKTGNCIANNKIKFRPASEVLAGKSDNEYDENKVLVSDVNDEERRNEIEESEVGGHVIHQPQLGALCSSSSKRSSWSAEMRQEKPKANKWVPRTRKCTRCGSTDHTIYDCTLENPFYKPSSLGCLL